MLLQWTASLEYLVWKWNEHVFVCRLWTQSIPHLIHLGTLKLVVLVPQGTSDHNMVSVEPQAQCRLMQLPFSRQWAVDRNWRVKWQCFEIVTILCFLEWILLTYLWWTTISSSSRIKKKYYQSSWTFGDLMLLLCIIFLSTTSQNITCTVLWSLFPHSFHTAQVWKGLLWPICL